MSVAAVTAASSLSFPRHAHTHSHTQTGVAECCNSLRPFAWGSTRRDHQAPFMWFFCVSFHLTSAASSASCRWPLLAKYPLSWYSATVCLSLSPFAE
uniref:Putative secreted protein n=1 Tax=Anopheles marajoara TaxID=58244 RepID=A0A2M4C930_9DIPT